MSRLGLRRVGRLALIALTLQVAAGASDSPCASMDHSADDPGATAMGLMAGMPMPEGGEPDHSRDDCSDEQSVPACQTGSACALVAMPAVAGSLAASQGISPVPFSAPAMLLSAVTAPDQPPPRA